MEKNYSSSFQTLYSHSSDLRGYGDSDKPVSKANHSTYSKREMAKDQMLLWKN